MALIALLVISAACLAGYWWLGQTATPGQRAIEEHVRALRFSFLRTMGAKFKSADPDWWTRPTERQEPIPEPDEHKEPWRH
ncbi:MAG: hypothetical protein ACRDXE_07290 [Acidimicrobiales bacterium]